MTKQFRILEKEKLYKAQEYEFGTWWSLTHYVELCEAKLVLTEKGVYEKLIENITPHKHSTRLEI